MSSIQAKSTAQEKLNESSISTLKEAAIKLMDCFEDNSDFAFDEILDNLQARMDKKSFDDFCEIM
jgi:hypothetical protein